jgi:acyl-CoA reductase-like NAD-dependent aldehyde dehydrogenase
MKLGNPLDRETTHRPHGQYPLRREVRAQIRRGAADGAVAHIDASPADDGGAYLTPQVLTNVTTTCASCATKASGPVVGIMPVEDDDEAIALMNDSRFGLTASIWTRTRPQRPSATGSRPAPCS